VILDYCLTGLLSWTQLNLGTITDLNFYNKREGREGEILFGSSRTRGRMSAYTKASTSRKREILFGSRQLEPYLVTREARQVEGAYCTGFTCNGTGDLGLKRRLGR